MIFGDNLCVTKDCLSKSPIGVDRLRGGFYYFDNFSSSSVQINVVGSHNLWPGCLGHPSDQAVSLLFKDLNISNNFTNKGPVSYTHLTLPTKRIV